MSQFPDLEFSVERDGLGFFGEEPYNSTTTICHKYFPKGKRKKKLKENLENSGTEFSFK